MWDQQTGPGQLVVEAGSQEKPVVGTVGIIDLPKENPISAEKKAAGITK
jgi:hypothetical protein